MHNEPSFRVKGTSVHTIYVPHDSRSKIDRHRPMQAVLRTDRSGHLLRCGIYPDATLTPITLKLATGDSCLLLRIVGDGELELVVVNQFHKALFFPTAVIVNGLTTHSIHAKRHEPTTLVEASEYVVYDHAARRFCIHNACAT